MNIGSHLRPAAAACIVLALASAASAQITTGSVVGTVMDPQGAVIPGATVTLVNEAQGTRSTPVVTNSTGDFVFANVNSATYTIEVEMSSFKTLRRSGIIVSAGQRVPIGTLTIEVGGATEVIDVKGEAPMIQASTGERSFTVATDEVANLPLANRNFATLASLAPGVDGTNRIGGGGTTNFMMDGILLMDTSTARLLVAVNVESIGEVKVLTSTYQAEYGRSSGLQITAVTKSGTNRFHGSLYDVDRDSDWNANTKVNILNGDPKTVSKQRDWGYSLGGPIGKPGGNNKLFFFYAHEYQPRTAGNNVVRFRMPTALERQGDFSQSTDNLGTLYPYIKDPQLSGPCTSANQAGCFRDGGVLGRIPANRLYETGLNILKMYPLPNLTNIPAGQAYNFELTRPTEKLLGWQPVVRLDYQPLPSFRTSFKYMQYGQPKQTINGSLPGFNDSRMQKPIVFSWAGNVNYTISPTMFLESTFGRSQNTQAGCALVGGSPNYCTAAMAMNPSANLFNSGLGELPFLFPDANVIDSGYYAYDVLNEMQPPIWDGSRVLKTPAFSWGSRVSNNTNAPPTHPYPGFLNKNPVYDFSVSLTKVWGRHTLKTGFYRTHSLKVENISRVLSFGSVSFQQDTVGTNPFDTSFGFANAAIGSFSSFQQQSKYFETATVGDNVEAYIQDNWKVNRKLTLDYGLRFVNQGPNHDIREQSSNFLPEEWARAAAPALYVAGCANGVYPCSGTNRQAMNPLTGAFLGPNSTLAIGTMVPNSGNTTNGLFMVGRNIAEPGAAGCLTARCLDKPYNWPALAVTPRFGLAYDLTGDQRFVLRGGVGLFIDRDGISNAPPNPPSTRNVTVRYGQLQTLGLSGLTTEVPAAMMTYQFEPKLPSSTQWNWGVQMALPWSVALDLSYVGQHSWNTRLPTEINGVDLGAAFLPENQDRTLAPSATPGGTAIAVDLMRPFQGYSSIDHRLYEGWRTYHSLQVSFQRRFRNGVSFGFNDTMGLSDKASVPLRLQHNPDGSFFVRGDQAEAQALLGDQNPQAHIMKAHFVWDLPDLRSSRRSLRGLGYVINDWQLSGIWTGATGAPYTVTYAYQSGGSNVNLTGSPDYDARIRLVGDPGSGCSSDLHRQFNTAAFQGPLVGSVGLESGNDYLRGCFSSVLDLAVARNIRLGGGRNLQLRADLFNVPNGAGITGRNTSLGLTNPSNPVTPTNLPFDDAGNLVDARSRPRGAGFGVANNFQAPRSVQFQVRFSF
jgi:hypothetical protein